MLRLWQSAMSKRKNAQTRHSRKSRPAAFAPRLEPLEERALPALITWVGGSGDWNTPANWSTGSLPGPQDDAVIDRPEITVTHASEVHRINSLVTANGTFHLNGGTLDVTTTLSGDSVFQLRGGRLANATMAAGTTLTSIISSALDRVTLAVGATLNPSVEIEVYNGMVVDGTVNLGGLHFRGTQSLLGSGRLIAELRGTLRQENANESLTLGPNLTFQGQGITISSAGSLVNHAAISITSSSINVAFYIFAQSLTNAGTIHIQGSSINYQAWMHGNTWTNTGQITVTGNAVNTTTLIIRGNYWTNRGTLSMTNADIAFEGMYRPSGIGNFTRSGGRVSLSGTLDVRGETLELNASTGSWTCGGTILGGSVVFRDGALLPASSGCILDGVTFNSDVDWATQGNSLRIRNGLTVNGRLLLGNASGTSSVYIIFQGNSTLSVTGGAVFGGSNNNSFAIEEVGSITIAANTSLRGRSALISARTLINYGTILSDTAGGGFTITGGDLINEGVLGAENGGGLTLRSYWTTDRPFQFSGPSRLTLDGFWSYAFPLAVTSGSVTLAGNWRLSHPLTVRDATVSISSTTGSWGVSSLTAVNSTLNLGDGFHPSNLSLNLTSTRVDLVGRVDNVGRELLLNAATGNWNLRGGQIVGGTVRTTDGTRLSILATVDNPRSVLDGIVLEGEMDIPHLYTQVIIRNGLTLNGTFYAGTVIDPGPAYIFFDGTQTVTSTRTGTIILRGWMETSVIPPATVTFAPNITVRGEGRILSRSTSIINLGTIHADRPGGTLSIEAPNWSSHGGLRATNGGILLFQGGSTLNGVVDVSGGSRLLLGGQWTNRTTITASSSTIEVGYDQPWSNAGTILATDSTVRLSNQFTTAGLGTIQRQGGTVELAGTLDNAGRTLVLDQTSGSWLFSGEILGGTVRTNGVALIPTRGGRFSNGVVFHGDLDLSQTPNAQLIVNQGLTLNGTIWLGNEQGTRSATLEFPSTQTLGSATGGHVVFGGSAENRISATGASTRLTLGAGIVVRGNRGALIAARTSFENQGVIQADVKGGSLTLSGVGWTNVGTIQALNGGELITQGTTTNYANGTLTGGAWAVYANSTLRVQGVNVVTNAATIGLAGSQSYFYSDLGQTDALAEFSVNGAAGVLFVQDGRTLATFGSFINAGQVLLGRNSFFSIPGLYEQTDGVTELQESDSTLSAALGMHIAGGWLTGRGLLDAEVWNEGRIAVGGFGSAGRLVINGNLVQSSPGELLIELGGFAPGVSHDQLVVAGYAWLGGLLKVELLPDFSPQLGDQFEVLVFAERLGAFEALEFPDLGPTLRLHPTFSEQSLTLVTSATRPSPGGSPTSPGQWVVALREEKRSAGAFDTEVPKRRPPLLPFLYTFTRRSLSDFPQPERLTAAP